MSKISFDLGNERKLFLPYTFAALVINGILIACFLGLLMYTVYRLAIGSIGDEFWVHVVVYFLFAVRIIFHLCEGLIISPAGIIYFQIGLRIQSSWVNIGRVERVVYGMEFGDVLTLRMAKFEKIPWLVWLRIFHPISNVQKDWRKVPVGEVIPLSSFDKEWQEGDLGNAMRQYMPQTYQN